MPGNRIKFEEDQELPHKHSVLLKTSCGELDIELWSKEAPKACRNFVQLCMEGYYDGTIFHRIIRNFMAQGGDPTGTGEGGESIYGRPFRDEFHSRLRFARRGLVAMANAGPHDNSSQFFITLGPCEHLQGKHTIFGKIGGNTIFNAVKLGEVDIGADDRPVYPPKIKATQVLANPFDDIIPRQMKKKHEKEEKKTKSKSKATKNFSLLSFGEEAEEDEEETVVASQSMKNKSKSMHDLVNDPKLSSVPAVEIEKEEKPSVEERLHPEPTESDEYDEEEQEEERKRQEEERIKQEKKKESADKIRSKLTKERKKSEDGVKGSPKEEKSLSRKEELQEESRKLKDQLREDRKRKQKQESHQEAAKLQEEMKEEEPSSKGDELDEFHAQKKKFKAMKKTMVKKGSSREEQTLAMLAKFQNKLHSAILNKKPEPEKMPEEEKKEEEKEEGEKEEGEYMEGEEEKKEKGEEEEEGGEEWLVHSLQFESHDNKVKDANVSDADTFTIFDPRNPMNKRRREDSKQKKKERR